MVVPSRSTRMLVCWSVRGPKRRESDSSSSIFLISLVEDALSPLKQQGQPSRQARDLHQTASHPPPSNASKRPSHDEDSIARTLFKRRRSSGHQPSDSTMRLDRVPVQTIKPEPQLHFQPSIGNRPFDVTSANDSRTTFTSGGLLRSRR